jgi:hypothetical protein
MAAYLFPHYAVSSPFWSLVLPRQLLIIAFWLIVDELGLFLMSLEHGGVVRVCSFFSIGAAGGRWSLMQILVPAVGA